MAQDIRGVSKRTLKFKSPIISTAEQWREMQPRQFPFYQNVTREGILVWKNTYAPTLVHAQRWLTKS